MTESSNALSLPLVSLVTPVFNQGHFVEATIASVLAQDYPNIEYQVIDDGSTDATEAILQRYQPPINWERHENVGQSATLNKGWNRARGTYLGYLSADDRLHPPAIRRLVETLERNPEAVVAYCDFDLIDETGRKCGDCISPEWTFAAMTENLICPPGPGALFRRSAFDAAGGWNSTLKRIPDFEFWLRLGRLGTFVRVGEPLAEYRVHAESGVIRPIPAERSDEFVRVMRAFWGNEQSPASRRSLSIAHFKSAVSHAQSGRPAMALSHFAQSTRYAPRRAASPEVWKKFIHGFLMRAFRNHGRIASWLR